MEEIDAVSIFEINWAELSLACLGKNIFVSIPQNVASMCVCLRLFFLSAVDDAVLQERERENRFVWGKRNVSSSVL